MWINSFDWEQSNEGPRGVLRANDSGKFLLEIRYGYDATTDQFCAHVHAVNPSGYLLKHDAVLRSEVLQDVLDEAANVAIALMESWYDGGWSKN